MSNRLLGLLIVLGFILAGIAFYLYAFVTYRGALQIQSNIGEYTVKLSGNKASEKNDEQVFCAQSTCTVTELSPFEYKVIITKAGYKSQIMNIEIPRRNTVVIEVSLEKDTLLSQVQVGRGDIQSVESRKGESNEKQSVFLDAATLKKISSQERIEKIRKKKSYYQYFYFESFGEVYFIKRNNRLELGITDLEGAERILERFNDVVPADSIDVFEVIGNNQMVLIQYGAEKYLYNRATVSFEEINFKPEIIYLKMFEGRDIAFVTDKGMFVYSKDREGSFEYMSNFYDSVYVNGDLVGVIQEDDIQRKKNMGFSKENGDIIILQDQEVKQRRIIYKPDFTVSKIYLEDGKVMVESEKSEKFVLENY